MGMGCCIIFYLSIIHGSIFVKPSILASDQLTEEPFVWIKGCHRKPSSGMKTVSLADNDPGRCFRCCGTATQTVAVRNDKCICLSTASRPMAAPTESLCNNPCPGDINLKCGGQTSRAWSLYQRVSETEIRTMDLLPNTTGCGVASSTSSGFAYKMVPCHTSASLVCMNSITGCQDLFGEFTWFEAVTECGELYSSILPYQTLCQTVTLQTSYWLGLYRSKAYGLSCETTTPSVRSTTKQTEKPTPNMVVTKQFTGTTDVIPTEGIANTLSESMEPEQLFTSQSSEPTKTTLSKPLVFHSRTPEYVFTTQAHRRTATHKPEHITTELYHVSKESPSLMEKSTAISTIKATTSSKSNVPTLLTTNKRNGPFSSQPSLKSHISTITPIRMMPNVFTTPRTKTNLSSEAKYTSPPYAISNKKSSTPNAVYNKKSSTPNTISYKKSSTPTAISSKKSSTPNAISYKNPYTPNTLSNKKPSTPNATSSMKSSTLNAISRKKSSTQNAEPNKKSSTPNVISNKKSSTPYAVSNMKPEYGNIEVKRSRDSGNIDNFGKLTIAILVVGTVLSILLMAIFLMLCRISRILQKKSYTNTNCTQRKHEQRLRNSSYLTDGSVSYPIPRSDLCGNQHTPFPNSGVYGSTPRVREKASNMFIPWYDRRRSRRQTSLKPTLDRRSEYSDAWEGRMDDYELSEDEARYYEPIRTTNIQ